MTFHRLVDIHGVAVGRIKASQPHVTHYHQLQWIINIFKTFFEKLFGFFIVNMRLQLFFVRCRTGHDNFNRTFVGVSIMPFGFKGDDGIVHIYAYFTTHADNHAFAGHGSDTALKMGDQVFTHLFHARRTADQFF